MGERHVDWARGQTVSSQLFRGVAHHILHPTVHAVVDSPRFSGGVVVIGGVEVHELLGALYGLVHVMEGQEHEKRARIGRRIPDDSGHFLRIKVWVGSGVAAIAWAVRAVQIDAAVNRTYCSTRRVVGGTVELFCCVVRCRDGILATVTL